MPDSVVTCLECSWKIVTAEPSAHMGGHMKRTNHRSIVQEIHEPEHPTMTHAKAEEGGHCWHVEAMREDDERGRAGG